MPKNAKNEDLEIKAEFESLPLRKINSEISAETHFFTLIQKTVPKNVPCINDHRKRFLRTHKPYKNICIIRNKSGDWFVKFFYQLPQQSTKFKEFRVRDGVNYIHDPELKEKAIQELKKDIIYCLEKLHYNPFKQSESVKAQIAEAREVIKKMDATMTLGAALMWFIDAKKGKGKSEETLRGYNNQIKWFVEYRGLETRINDVTIDDIESYLTSKLDNEDWSARTYNNNIGTLTTFFNYLVAKRKLKVNPIGKGMLETIKNTAEKNRYYDEATLAKIMPEVKKKPNLRRFMLWTYYSCARGSELRSLKIKHLDLNIKKISIMAEHGKTGEHVGKRSIPICEELMELIVEDNLAALNPEWYIFGNKGKPGELESDEDYFSKQYHKIKVDKGIDFRWSIYGLKHSRVISLLIAGFDPIKVMYLTGHTNWGSFQNYIRELSAVMDKEMTGKTIKLNL